LTIRCGRRRSRGWGRWRAADKSGEDEWAVGLSDRGGMGAEATGRLPDFVCVGGQRCATSWLFEAMRHHPEVFMPRKEVHFFDHHYADGLGAYRALFAEAGAGRICGEITPDYLTDPSAVERLASDLPAGAKLIVLLRDPVERAYSHYRLLRIHGRCRPGESFVEAFGRDKCIRENSLFGKHVGGLVDRVGAGRVRCWTHESVTRDPGGVLSEVLAWLGVDATYRPVDLTSRHNVSTGAGWQERVRLPALLRGVNASPVGPAYRAFRRTAAAHRMRNWLHGSAGRGASGPTAADRRALWPRFAEDVAELERATGLDLSGWRVANGAGVARVDRRAA